MDRWHVRSSQFIMFAGCAHEISVVGLLIVVVVVGWEKKTSTTFDLAYGFTYVDTCRTHVTGTWNMLSLQLASVFTLPFSG
jgi:hypothetical protein